jgi:hypothetical protein
LRGLKVPSIHWVIRLKPGNDASPKPAPSSLGGKKGGHFVTEENEPVMGSGPKKASRGDPDVFDEIIILDYVMLDFVDEFCASRKNAPRLRFGPTLRHDDQEGILSEA